MRLAVAIFAIYLLVLIVGYGLNKGLILLPAPEPIPAPAFDEPRFVGGVKEVGVVAYFNGLVPIEGKAVSEIKVHGTAYNPGSRLLKVWLSAAVRGTYFIFTSDCYVAEAGGWFCTRPVDSGGYIRVKHEVPLVVP